MWLLINKTEFKFNDKHSYKSLADIQIKNNQYYRIIKT